MNIDDELMNARIEAYSAARLTVHSAAWSAARSTRSTVHSAAWSAAWSAEYSAAHLAARSAARSAAWALYNASSYKEELEQVRIIKEML